MVESAPSDDPLSMLGRLALEYQQKYSEVEALVQQTSPERLGPQLRFQSQLTIDRFRAAQQVLVQALARDSGIDVESLTPAILAVSRSFDEMVILFQMVLEQLTPSQNPASER